MLAVEDIKEDVVDIYRVNGVLLWDPKNIVSSAIFTFTESSS